MDVIQQKILAGDISRAATLSDVLPEDVRPVYAHYGVASRKWKDMMDLKGIIHFQSELCEALSKQETWKRENPALWDAIFEADADFADAVYCKPNKAVQLPSIFSVPVAETYGITETTQEEKSTHIRYPKDAEALALLDAAAKLKVKLAKKNPNITNKDVIQNLLNEPDVGETKKQENQRLKHQYRVWYGALKNGERKNTTTMPERLDPKIRAATWSKLFADWGKHLSCYMKHPPAK